ncbi:MAG TPA: TolC family protein [Tepidisphaeraceae bacterium]|jgi:outer membrane protein TolC
MRRTSTFVLLSLAALAGCTPNQYRDWADRDAQRLIKDRQQKTVGYTPQAEPSKAENPLPTKKAYATVPVTRVPDIGGEPVRPNDYRPSLEPAGPPVPQDSSLPAVESDMLQQAAATQQRRFDYGPPAAMGNRRVLDLFSSIHFAVQNSRQYQTRSEDLYLSALDVTLERYLFTPRPFVRTNVDYTGGQGDVDYRSALNVTQRIGVRQQLPYGGEVVAEGLVGFVQGLNGNVEDGETAQVALTGSIPLWRGAGLVNLEPLIASERTLVYSTREFEDFRRQFAVEVATRFFRVQTRYQSLRNRYLAYRNLRDLVVRTEALFGAGRVTALELQRVQSQLLQREDQINTAQESLESDLDDFKLLIGMPIEQPLELAGTEVLIGAIDEYRAAPAQLALRYRLDLQTARDQVQDAHRNVANAQNGLAPDVNLEGGARVGDGDALRLRGDSLEYNAGLRVDLPVDRLAERNAYRRALIRLEQARRRVLESEENVLSDVRTAERAIRAAQSSLVIQRASITLAQRRLDFANESLLLGRTTDTRNSIEAEDTLLRAQDAFDRARADLQVRMLEFLRDTGTLRVDPGAGTLGLAMQRNADEPAQPVTTRPADSAVAE